jgi:hypothetical protein
MWKRRRVSSSIASRARSRARWNTEAVPLDHVARAERPLPARYVVGDFDVDPSFAEEMSVERAISEETGEIERIVGLASAPV